MEADRAADRAVKEAKRVCGLIAKMVRDFWQNVDKVVDIHVQVSYSAYLWKSFR